MKHQANTKRQFATLRRNGAVVVEFAIVAPIFFVFILGAFEFGRLNVIRHTADNAAYEAARNAIVPGATSTEAVNRAMSILNVVGTRGARVSVDPPTLGPDVKQVTVTIEVPMSQNGWVVPQFTSGTSIRTSSTMRTEFVED